jgi:hypothetical protein
MDGIAGLDGNRDVAVVVVVVVVMIRVVFL